MDYKTTYHAISQPDIKSFNDELKQYTDEGYIPYGPMAVAISHTESFDEYVVSIYSILLSKTIKVEA
jgi:hypothetical protein